jgi:hypothetical protein
MSAIVIREPRTIEAQLAQAAFWWLFSTERAMDAVHADRAARRG